MLVKRYELHCLQALTVQMMNKSHVPTASHLPCHSQQHLCWAVCHTVGKELCSGRAGISLTSFCHSYGPPATPSPLTLPVLLVLTDAAVLSHPHQ